jgi:hypothetical protein
MAPSSNADDGGGGGRVKGGSRHTTHTPSLITRVESDHNHLSIPLGEQDVNPGSFRVASVSGICLTYTVLVQQTHTQRPLLR